MLKLFSPMQKHVKNDMFVWQMKFVWMPDWLTNYLDTNYVLHLRIAEMLIDLKSICTNCAIIKQNAWPSMRIFLSMLHRNLRLSFLLMLKFYCAIYLCQFHAYFIHRLCVICKTPKSTPKIILDKVCRQGNLK